MLLPVPSIEYTLSAMSDDTFLSTLFPVPQQKSEISGSSYSLQTINAARELLHTYIHFRK